MDMGTKRNASQTPGAALLALCLLPGAAAAQPGANGTATDDPFIRAPEDADSALQSEAFEVAPTLSGCFIPLPGGGDRDSGLTSLYIDNRQGRELLVAPSISVAEIYSDNVTLAPSGAEESDWVTQITPGITVCRNTARLHLQANYSLQALYYLNDSSRNDIYHQLGANGRAEVLPGRFYVDARTSYGQEAINYESAFSDDNALVTDNRTDVLRFSVSPYWIEDLGRVGTLSARYSYQRADYDEGLRDSTSNSANLRLVNPSAADTWSYALAYSTQRVEREDRSDPNYFDDAYVDLGYLVNANLRLLGRAGVETEYEEDGGVDRLGSSYWNVGFRWSDARTSVEARWGQRFFGDSFQLSASRRASLLTARLTYSEEPDIEDRFSLLSPEEFGLPGVIYDPDTGQFVELPPIVVSQNEVFLRKRATASLVYESARSVISGSVYNEQRDYFVTEDDQERLGVDLYWRWQWLPRTALIPRVGWERVEFRDGQVDYIRGARISVARLLSPQSQAGLTLRHQNRSSTSPAAEYEENAVILEFTHLF
jgi:uncharacterized protein (PEP-CTERM system associated)